MIKHWQTRHEDRVDPSLVRKWSGPLDAQRSILAVLTPCGPWIGPVADLRSSQISKSHIILLFCCSSRHGRIDAGHFRKANASPCVIVSGRNIRTWPKYSYPAEIFVPFGEDSALWTLSLFLLVLLVCEYMT